MDFPAINAPGCGQLYARLHTSQGAVLVLLEELRAPNTVKNFVGLAMGAINWKDPKTGQGMLGTPLYHGLRFHRVIPGFMVQAGDPYTRYTDERSMMKWGMGGPGYWFADEIHADLRHTGPGILSMANSGPNTNGSQFFITDGPAPRLDGKHAVFGRVLAGQSVVTRIANGSRSASDRTPGDGSPAPLLESVEVFRSESVLEG